MKSKIARWNEEMSQKLLVVIPMFFCAQIAFGQFVFRQDIVQGGITAAGFSTGQGSGSGSFDIYVEPGSTIKEAYALSYTARYPPPATFNLNGINFMFDTNNVIMNVHHNIPPWPFSSPIRLYYKDLTENIDPSITEYNVTIPFQPDLPINAGYWTLFLVVIYENPQLANTAYSILINDQTHSGLESYLVNQLNPINTFFPAGFSLYTDRTRNDDGISPNSIVTFNGNEIGTVGGSDAVNSNWAFGGVKGHFYYQNNQLFGLDDDIPNAFMNNTDGIADVSSYVNNNDSYCNFQLTHIQYPFQLPNRTNINLAYTLAYTTPCLPFETTLTEEVETCRGDTAHLLATGGQDYKWLPEEDLSCYNCPNPVFEGDSSKVYTVRIWNTDSCSKVLPVKVNVLDVPDNVNIATTPATCSESNGEISLSGVSGGQSPYQYNIGGNWTTNPSANMFSILEAGDYTLTIKDQNNCTLQQDFTIAEENPAHAAFTANPQSGTEPLEVQFTNQSSSTTHYEWSLGDSTFNDFEFNFTFDSVGSYPVQLVSWYIEPHCADTAMVTIIVHPDHNHSIFMPTLYSAQIGDLFIQTTNVQRVEFELYNAIGQHIFSTEAEVADGQNNLWNGSNYARGYYFFRLKYWDMQGLEFSERGKLLLVR